MFEWFKAEAARASRWKRCKASGSRAISSERNLRATKRRSGVSSAFHTTPMPPAPKRARSYGGALQETFRLPFRGQQRADIMLEFLVAGARLLEECIALRG